MLLERQKCILAISYADLSSVLLNEQYDGQLNGLCLIWFGFVKLAVFELEENASRHDIGVNAKCCLGVCD